ncbi:MAG: Rpn family recombination-promoting nuclease/putative transposase [Halomonas sp.]|uniref:Rpn family recombination-promoting nuclease/putative transposase n=1 Tax=Halomonas sp. TaxID=1486246 RepID=UPI002ACDF392|nr:Rpn family recombination-promoting nuclease/putative transposase [Halomonas sp.]MDZ7852554.1 Rpn family recombination-promoting nuclease/putative transposase [Halomonas sp.]
MTKHHDHSYKLLFSHKTMVKDLLTGFVKEAWVEQLDFSRMEKVSGSYVTDELRDREDDMIWRIWWRDRWLYVYLLLEFQSSVDKHMAVRVMSYLGLLYQDLIRQDAFTPSGKLPPVLPIVLYNGEQRWTAAQNVADLVESVPGGLERYRPQLSYLLLDEGALVNAPEWSDEMRNVAAALFRIEKHRSEQDVVDSLGHLADWLSGPEQASLRRAIIVWFYRVFLPNRAPSLEFPDVSDVTDLHEVHDMLAERIKKWPEQWEARGHEKGLHEGRQEGRHEGVEGTLRKQIELKFGGVPAWADERLAHASDQQLDTWVARILTADSLDNLFAEE